MARDIEARHVKNVTIESALHLFVEFLPKKYKQQYRLENTNHEALFEIDNGQTYITKTLNNYSEGKRYSSEVTPNIVLDLDLIEKLKNGIILNTSVHWVVAKLVENEDHEYTLHIIDSSESARSNDLLNDIGFNNVVKESRQQFNQDTIAGKTAEGWLANIVKEHLSSKSSNTVKVNLEVHNKNQQKYNDCGVRSVINYFLLNKVGISIDELPDELLQDDLWIKALHEAVVEFETDQNCTFENIPNEKKQLIMDGIASLAQRYEQIVDNREMDERLSDREQLVENDFSHTSNPENNENDNSYTASSVNEGNGNQGHSHAENDPDSLATHVSGEDNDVTYHTKPSADDAEVTAEQLQKVMEVLLEKIHDIKKDPNGRTEGDVILEKCDKLRQYGIDNNRGLRGRWAAFTIKDEQNQDVVYKVSREVDTSRNWDDRVTHFTFTLTCNGEDVKYNCTSFAEQMKMLNTCNKKLQDVKRLMAQEEQEASSTSENAEEHLQGNSLLNNSKNPSNNQQNSINDNSSSVSQNDQNSQNTSSLPQPSSVKGENNNDENSANNHHFNSDEQIVSDGGVQNNVLNSPNNELISSSHSTVEHRSNRHKSPTASDEVTASQNNAHEQNQPNKNYNSLSQLPNGGDNSSAPLSQRSSILFHSAPAILGGASDLKRSRSDSTLTEAGADVNPFDDHEENLSNNGSWNSDLEHLLRRGNNFEPDSVTQKANELTAEQLRLSREHIRVTKQFKDFCSNHTQVFDENKVINLQAGEFTVNHKNEYDDIYFRFSHDDENIYYIEPQISTLSLEDRILGIIPQLFGAKIYKLEITGSGFNKIPLTEQEVDLVLGGLNIEYKAEMEKQRALFGSNIFQVFQQPQYEYSNSEKFQDLYNTICLLRRRAKAEEFGFDNYYLKGLESGDDKITQLSFYVKNKNQVTTKPYTLYKIYYDNRVNGLEVYRQDLDERLQLQEEILLSGDNAIDEVIDVINKELGYARSKDWCIIIEDNKNEIVNQYTEVNKAFKRATKDFINSNKKNYSVPTQYLDKIGPMMSQFEVLMNDSNANDIQVQKDARMQTRLAAYKGILENQPLIVNQDNLRETAIDVFISKLQKKYSKPKHEEELHDLIKVLDENIKEDNPKVILEIWEKSSTIQELRGNDEMIKTMAEKILEKLKETKNRQYGVYL